MEERAASAEATQGSRVGAFARAGLQLLALSFQPAIALWSVNVDQNVDPVPLLAVAAMTFGAAVVLVTILRAVLASLPRALAVVSVLIVVFYGWDLLRNSSERIDARAPSFVGALFALFVVAFAVVVAYAYGRTTFFRTTAIAFSLGVLAASLANLGLTYSRVSETPLPQVPVGVVNAQAGNRPDIYYVVLDGYGREDVLRTLYGHSNDTFTAELRDRGFHVPSKAVTNYSMTYVSVPGTLSMEYVIESGRPLTSNQLITLHRRIGGDNSVVRNLKAAGYEYWHLESGWSGARCGALVDRCVSAPFLDDALWALLGKTPLASTLTRRVGHPYTLAAPSRFDELRSIASNGIEGSRKPRFVFAHVLLPHAPLYFGSDCATHFDAALEGTMVGGPENVGRLDRRKIAYADQVVCVNRRLSAFLDVVDPGSVVLFLADHGPDSYGQLATIPLTGWSRDAILERMAIFAALRMPPACRAGLPDAFAPVNAFRLIFRCLFDAPLPDLAHRSILVPPVVEKFRTLEVAVPDGLGAG